MLLHPSQNGNGNSNGGAANPAHKMMERLPVELIEMVVLRVKAINDLRSLARVNKLFQELAEPHIYKDVLIRKGDQARKLAAALTNKPQRATWVRSLRNACMYNCFSGLADLPALLPIMKKLEKLVVETPDCNAVEAESRLPWIAQQHLYRDIFWMAAIPNSQVLPMLRSCTLHFVDEHRSLYPLSHYSIIFLHPSLTNLTISCANIAPPHLLHPMLLQPNLTHTTALTTLKLIECDMTLVGLYHLLRLPRALLSLTITEANHYVLYVRDRSHTGLLAPKSLIPIAELQPRLRHLCIARLRYNDVHLLSIPPLDLTPFTSLQAVEYAHVQNPHLTTIRERDWCDLVHREGPQANTGGPNTAVLIYSDIPMQWCESSIRFFKCAFLNKVSHGIGNLRVLKLILVDHEWLIACWIASGRINEQQRRPEAWRAATERARTLVRELGVLGRRPDIGVRVLVEWVRPNPGTIPPYLTGEQVPQLRPEYDSAIEIPVAAGKV
jgi:hypothetical protein